MRGAIVFVLVAGLVGVGALMIGRYVAAGRALRMTTGPRDRLEPSPARPPGGAPQKADLASEAPNVKTGRIAETLMVKTATRTELPPLGGRAV